MTNMDVNDFLAESGGGAPPARFDQPGDSVTGTIVHHEVRQMFAFGTTEPEFWPDGNPKYHIVITLQTDQRDPDNPDDDGQRRVFAPKPSNMFVGLQRARNGQRFEVGGHLAIKFTGTAKTEKGFQAKQYELAYQQSTTNPAVDALLDDKSTDVGDLL